MENISLFAEAINRRLRQQLGEGPTTAVLAVDLSVTVAELGKDLFRELKLLEPCGIGNPAPRLLIRNCWFDNLWNRNIQDWQGRKIRYIKTEFEIWDDTTETGFPGLWWDHYKDEIPIGRCDAVVELDFNTYKKRYEVRLLAVRAAEQQIQTATEVPTDWILDWRRSDAGQAVATEEVLLLTSCPSSWDELYTWFRRAVQRQQRLAIAYTPYCETADAVWQRLVGIAKYLSRTGETVARSRLSQKLGLSDRSLQLGFCILERLGFEVTDSDEGVQIGGPLQGVSLAAPEMEEAIAQFTAVVQEEQFRQRYFYEAPLATLQAIAAQAVRTGPEPDRAQR